MTTVPESDATAKRTTPRLPLTFLCVAIGGYAERWHYCIETQRRYCERNGYRHELVERIAEGLHPKWTKLAIARDLLRAGHDVVMIDADAEMTDAAPPARTVFDASPAHDIFFIHGRSGRPNSGVMFLRGGADSGAVAFIEACLAARGTRVPKEDFVTDTGENGHVIHFLKKEPFRSRARQIGREWNCTQPEYVPGAFVRHFTGPLRALYPQFAGAGAVVRKAAG